MPETSTVTIGELLDNFTGRRDDPDFEQRKTFTYRIHRRNRAYVWKQPKRQRFLDSIMKGYHIPAIVVHDTLITDPDGRPRSVREIMDGGNRITTARLIDTNRAGFDVSPEERAALRATSIAVVVLRNLTPAQQREMFKRMNDPTKVSAGQLFAMSDDAALVQEAISLIESATFPERQRLDTHFPCIAQIDPATGQRKDSDGRTKLANAVGIIGGLLYGCKYITTSFDRHEDVLLTTINQTDYLPLLRIILDVFDEADAALEDFDKRKRLQQWGLGFVLGPMIYDIKEGGPLDIASFKQKWKNYIIRVRAKTPNAEEAITTIGSANNLTPTRLRRMSVRVTTFLAEGRLLTKDELKTINHVMISETETFDEEEDSESVE